MNAEQKQQAKQLIADWTNVSRTSTPAVWFLNGDCMAGFLQELVDAPSPEPVGFTNETELDYVRTYEALPVSGAFWPTSDEDACVALYTAPPANNQSEQNLEMVNAPAPSVTDGRKMVPDEPTAEMREAGHRAAWRRIPSLFDEDDAANVYRSMLAAAPAAPEPPALTDERIFKLFLEKAVDKGTAGIYDFARAIEREILGGGE